MPQNIFDHLRALADEIYQEKQAALGLKTAKVEPDPSMGKSKHPTEKMDDGGQEPPEGERYREMTEYNREHVQHSLDNKKPREVEGEDVQQSDYGAGSPGDLPEVERDYKKKLEDPGTSHPARVDKEKTADDVSYANLSFKEAYDRSMRLGEEILQDIVRLGQQAVAPQDGTAKQASHSDNGQPVQPVDDAAALQELIGEIKQAAGNVDDDALDRAVEYGRQLADKVASDLQDGASTENDPQQVKAAAEQRIYDILKAAAFDADLVGQFYARVNQQKQAMGDVPPEAAAAMAAGAMPPAQEEPPTAAGETVEIPVSEEDVEEAIPDAEPDEEEAIAELVAALDELGISPEELLATAETVSEEEDLEPEEEEKVARLQKIASAALAYKRSGKYRLHEAKTSAQRRLRDQMKQHVRELMEL